jgi:7-keto-8-aminopelargonate synthetase-like enzyme
VLQLYGHQLVLVYGENTAVLQALGQLKQEFGFLLLVDDAHSTLTLGPLGGGAAEAQGACACVDMATGTLSKAVGAMGGFVACSAATKLFLLNAGRAYVYSTALPVPVVAGAIAALHVFQRCGHQCTCACAKCVFLSLLGRSNEPPTCNAPVIMGLRCRNAVGSFLAVSSSNLTTCRDSWRAAHLARLRWRMEEALQQPCPTPVISVIIGSAEAAISMSQQLWQQGFHVPAIRPPTVPEGTSRLRISLSADHSMQDVDALIAALQHCMRKAGDRRHGQGCFERSNL